MADHTSILHRIRSTGFLWPALFVIAGMALLVTLGNWQMERRAWKSDLIAKIAARGANPPLTARDLESLTCQPPGAPDPDLSCQYLTVRLQGTFDHGRERHVYGTFTTRPARGSSIAGFYVFTPFRIVGWDHDIVVNRGFVPEPRKNPASRQEGQIAGSSDITGLIRRAQPPGTFDATDNPRSNIFFVRDPVLLGLIPAPPSPSRPQPPFTVAARAWFYLDLAAPAPPSGLPHPSPGPATLTNRHLEYALTWYALAAALTGVFLVFARTRLQRAIEQ